MQHPVTGEYTPPDGLIGGRYYVDSRVERRRRHNKVMVGIAIWTLICLGTFELVQSSSQKVGTREEKAFVSKALSGQALAAYREVVIYPATNKHGIPAQSTPASNVQLDSGSSKNNYIGTFNSSIAVVNPIFFKGYTPIDIGEGGVSHGAALARRLDWLNESIVPLDTLTLCRRGVSAQVPRGAKFDPRTGRFNLLNGQPANDVYFGENAQQLVGDFKKQGYTEDNCN